MAAGTCGTWVGRNSTLMASVEFGWEQEPLNHNVGRNGIQMAGAEFGLEQALAGLNLARIASGLENWFVGPQSCSSIQMA